MRATGKGNGRKTSSKRGRSSTPKKKNGKLGNIVRQLKNAEADAISDRYVDLTNTIIAEMREKDTLSPITLLVGNCLGMMALLMTMPDPKPQPIETLKSAVMVVLLAFLDEAH
jgi:hypothetical protein